MEISRTLILSPDQEPYGQDINGTTIYSLCAPPVNVVRLYLIYGENIGVLPSKSTKKRCPGSVLSAVTRWRQEMLEGEWGLQGLLIRLRGSVSCCNIIVVRIIIMQWEKTDNNYHQ